MRIALVHLRQARVGGTEQLLNALSAHLARRGHEVTIVCRTHEDPPHPGVRFHALHSLAPGRAARAWAFARDVERHVERAGYELTVGLGKTWSHDVVRTGGGTHAAYLELAAPHEEGPLERALGLRTLQDRVALAIERRGLAPGAYRAVIANSRMVERDLRARYGVPAEKLRVIYNGVDLQRFRPAPPAQRAELRRALGLAQGDVALLFVGGGFGRKGLERLLRALAHFARERSEVQLLVVGGDSRQANYERLAEQLGLRGRVRFLGRRSDPESCYRAADLFALPTWYDSFGFSVLEAMASGLPVITTELAGASELVEPGLHGEVLRGECGPEEIAAALRAWMDPERRAHGGRAAAVRAAQYGFERTLAELESTLLEAAPART